MNQQNISSISSKASSSGLPEKVQSALRLIHDSRGFWRVQVTPVDEKALPYEAVYSNFQVVGNGSFGVVCLAKDMKKNENIAIKIVFQDRRYKNRELSIVRMLNHRNVVKLREFFYKVDEQSSDNDLYLSLVLEYVPDTIFNISQKYLKHKRLIPPLHIKLYIYQLLRALTYIHSLGICHRDIKPQNLLLDPTTGIVKLCDFGSAKQLVSGEANVSYICSRYYRAPELLLGAADYTTAVDVWSAGCVLAEMMIGSPIFPGKSDVDQMVQIIKVLGTPSKEQLLGMNPKYPEFKFPSIQACNLAQIFPQMPSQLTLDFLLKMLVYLPSKRITALEALAHPYFDELRDPNVIYSPGKALPTLFDFSEQELSSNPALLSRLLPQHLQQQGNSSNGNSNKSTESSPLTKNGVSCGGDGEFISPVEAIVAIPNRGHAVENGSPLR